MKRVRAIAGLVILAVFGMAAADDIRLSADEIDNLGVRFVSPVPATGVVGFEATAIVVLPTTGDAVISAPQTGVLSRLAANIGDEVQRGQVLAELHSPAFISLQREFLDALNAQRLARTEFERDTELHAEGIIAARRLQETTARTAIADTALDEHRQLLRFAGMRDADIRSLESGRRLLESLLIRAPFSGVITERMVSTGERIDAMSPIYRLIDTTELWLDINVPQEQLAMVRPGARVETTAGAVTCPAVVTTVGRAVDPATQSAIVRARIDENDACVSPGQFVSVRVFADEPGADGMTVLELPATAVMRSGAASYVFKRTDGGVAVVEIEVIGLQGDRALVRGGLDTGSAIAGSGVAALKALWAAGDEES